MKAAIVTAYGGPDVIRIAEVPTPSPKKNEVLIRIHASAVNAADWRLRRANPGFVRLIFGFTRPRKPILGVVFAGEVVEAGAAVSKYKVGDRLFGWTGALRLGAHAEFIALPQNGAFAHMPATMPYTEAAAIPFGFSTALYFLRKAKVGPGQRVLVYGASGAVGSAAVQLAKQLGAEVTGVCGTRNMDLVRSIGANPVIDYTKDDLNSQRDGYDLVFEAVGKLPFQQCIALAKDGGTIILASDLPADMLKRAFSSKGGKKLKVIAGTTDETAEAIAHLASLWEQKAIRPVIDSTFPLERIGEAHMLAESWRKRGNVVVVMDRA